MKLKKVAALCGSANAFCLFDRVDSDGVVTQWLGDGCCAFPLHGLPVLSEPELYRMFDVSEKKQDKIYFNHSALPEGLNVEDWCRSEVRAEDMDVTISSGGKVLMPLRFPAGCCSSRANTLGRWKTRWIFWNSTCAGRTAAGAMWWQRRVCWSRA